MVNSVIGPGLDGLTSSSRKLATANRDGFVEALRVYVDGMENAFGIGEGDPAS